MAQAKSNTEILERGNIYFCYTPKVERDDVKKLGRVINFILFSLLMKNKAIV